MQIAASACAGCMHVVCSSEGSVVDKVNRIFCTHCHLLLSMYGLGRPGDANVSTFNAHLLAVFRISGSHTLFSLHNEIEFLQ